MSYESLEAFFVLVERSSASQTSEEKKHTDDLLPHHQGEVNACTGSTGL
jgi:hypothetical protein